MTQEALLDKLKKIKDHADSAKAIGNEAEAQVFAAKLQELLLRHKLEMTDINYAKEMQSEPIIEHCPDIAYVWNAAGNNRKRVYKDFPDIEVKEQRCAWGEQLAAVIAEFNSCRILVSTGWSLIHFVGHKSNVAICEYLFLTLFRAAEKMSVTAAKKFRAEQRKLNGGAGNTPAGYRESWLEGFITRIAQRLRDERDAFGKSEANASTALVRVNREALAVKNYMEEKKGTKTAKAIGGRSNFNSDGYADGKRAANDVNLKGNAMKEGQANKQLEN